MNCRVKKKLARRISKGEIQDDSEFRRERVEIVEVKRKILAREDALKLFLLGKK